MGCHLDLVGWALALRLAGVLLHCGIGFVNQSLALVLPIGLNVDAEEGARVGCILGVHQLHVILKELRLKRGALLRLLHGGLRGQLRGLQRLLCVIAVAHNDFRIIGADLFLGGLIVKVVGANVRLLGLLQLRGLRLELALKLVLVVALGLSSSLGDGLDQPAFLSCLLGAREKDRLLVNILYFLQKRLVVREYLVDAVLEEDIFEVPQLDQS